MPKRPGAFSTSVPRFGRPGVTRPEPAFRRTLDLAEAGALVLVDPDGLTAHHGDFAGVKPGPEVGENLHVVAGQHDFGPYLQRANRPHRASVPRSEQGTLKAAQQLFNRSSVNG